MRNGRLAARVDQGYADHRVVTRRVTHLNAIGIKVAHHRTAREIDGLMICHQRKWSMQLELCWSHAHVTTLPVNLVFSSLVRDARCHRRLLDSGGRRA